MSSGSRVNAEDKPKALEFQREKSLPAALHRGVRFVYRDLLLTLAFIALFLVQLVHHNMWRDELNAFGIAVAAPTLGSLFHLIHYEGHPWLWYVLLWIVSKGTVFPWGMKVLEGLVGIGIYFMLGMASPFSWWEKMLIALGYFITFEYTVMVRMYGVMVLLALIYAWQRTKHPERVFMLALLLGLMASTDAIGLILSVALAAEYVDSARERYGRRLAGAALVYAALIGIAVSTAWVTADISWRTNNPPLTSARDPAHLLRATYEYIVVPYFLAENRPLRYFWIVPSAHAVFYICCVPVVLFVYWTIFRAHRNLLLLMGVTIVGGILFGHLIYHGAQRQFGITVLAFLLGLWMLRTETSRLPAAAYVLLGLTAIGGVTANFAEWAEPFSNVEPAVKWLQANHLADGPIVGTPDTTVASVAELLHSPIYMLDCNCSDTFLLFSKRRDQFLLSQVPERMMLARKNLNVSNFVFVESHPMSATEAAGIAGEGLTVTPLIRFTGAEVSGENFYIYRIADANQPAVMQP